MKVDVYWNVREKKFSVRAREGSEAGRVIFHKKHVIIRQPRFIVSEAGRQRVLKEKQKNVHAVVRGELVEGEDFFETFKNLPLERLVSVTYNPYVHTTFIDQLTRLPVYSLDTALMVEENSKPIVLAI